MSVTWEKRDTETPYAFGAFCSYLDLGSKRTLRECSEKGGYSVYGVRKWSARHDWDSRATAYDIADLRKSIDGREQVRERARQVMMNDVEEAATTLGEVMRGKLTPPECHCEDIQEDPDDPDSETRAHCSCGASQPVMDRHGSMIGYKPTVAASTRQAAAQAILDRSGMTPPKRVELTGKDGEQLRLDARLAMGKLGDEQLGTILDVFGPDPDGD